MEITTSSVLEIWDMFSEHAPAGKRNDLAVKFLKLFVDQDIDIDELDELRGEDVHLDHALDTLGGGADYDEEFVEEYEE